MPRPKRGEIYWIDFSPARGSEQRGKRPGGVVQNDTGNQHSNTTVVVSVTTTPLTRPYPFAVALAAGEGGLRDASVVHCEQLLTIDQDRLGSIIGTLSEDRMLQIDAALRYELALE